MHVYAGIGSRRTPTPLLDVMTDLASRLATRGYVLRSGHAPGADQAFERGADSHAEVYLPWPTFEAAVACAAGYVQPRPSPQAVEMPAVHHPAWERLGRGPRCLHARNCHQILGRDLDAPASFVVCWTADGATTAPGRSTGGTGQALRIAAAYGVPVFNLARDQDLARVRAFIAGVPWPEGQVELLSEISKADANALLVHWNLRWASGDGRSGPSTSVSPRTARRPPSPSRAPRWARPRRATSAARSSNSAGSLARPSTPGSCA
jgi:hypothetical protein